MPLWGTAGGRFEASAAATPAFHRKKVMLLYHAPFRVKIICVGQLVMIEWYFMFYLFTVCVCMLLQDKQSLFVSTQGMHVSCFGV